ncbi:MAG TPA: enolase C-terminal domain-like protein [Gaiellaceae bacterium]|nr:enolase C-terminal domain-like protein [Gaiellaceae bacterium]
METRSRRLATPIGVQAPVAALRVSAFAVPTDEPESDGTAKWDSTSVVVVEASARGETGLGYTYAPAAGGQLVEELLVEVVRGRDALAPAAAWEAMAVLLRNAGRPGIGFCALSAVDQALWDLKARLLGVPLADLLGRARDEAPVYGSGGFTSYSLDRIREQLGGWVEQGIPRVKMKVSREPERDAERLDAARQAIGDEVELYVDSNGALGRKQALAWAERFAHEWGVTWHEEPVSSADFEGLRLLREQGPPGLEIAAGEYAYVPADFRNLLGCVDCLQADVTRCGGITGFLRAGALAAAFDLDLSAHCAPAASLAACCAVPRFRHLEWFHDHVRLEPLLFDGVPEPEDGALRPDRSRPGNGLELKRADAERYAA